jgi:hypothetical protein
MLRQMAPRKRLARQFVLPLAVTAAAALAAALWIMLWASQPLSAGSTHSTRVAVLATASGCTPNLTSVVQQPILVQSPRMDADEGAAWPSDLHPTSWQFSGVQKPRIAEGDIQLVPLCNASFVRQYPLTNADFERSYIPGSPCSMPPGLLQKMSSGQPVAITVVGGSMTQGRRCLDGKRWQRECSWSSRLQDRLRETFPTGNITVHNKAIPGYSYGHWLQSGMLDGLVQADVLVIDEQVNSHVSACVFSGCESLIKDNFCLQHLLMLAQVQKRCQSYTPCAVPHCCRP